MTKRQLGILGVLAVAVVCIFGTLAFLVVRDMRRDVGSMAAAPTPNPAANSQAAAGAKAVSLPADPVEAARQIQNRATTIQSAHVTMNLNLEVHVTPAAGQDQSPMAFPESVKVSAEGDFAKRDDGQPPDMHVTVRLNTQGMTKTIQVIQVDGHQWVNSEGKWEENKNFQKQAESIVRGSMISDTNPQDMLTQWPDIGNVERLPDETIDGVSTYHYRFSVDPKKITLPESLKDDPATGAILEELLRDLQFQFEVWAGKDNLWLRQGRLNLKAKFTAPPNSDQPIPSLSLKLDGLVKLSKFNEPVVIKPPM